MNKKLQDIFNIIQQSVKLDAEQKEKLLKAVKDADKELEITSFKLDRTEKVKKTTAILLEETIEELEQKRKAVEEQNRELEIETALERVRTQAMVMNKPEDILNTGKVLFDELRKLGFNHLRNTLISIFNDDGGFFMDYDYSDYFGDSVTKIFYNSHPVIEEFMFQIKKADDAFAEILIDQNQINGWEEFRKQIGEKPDPRLKNISSLYYYLYSIGSGSIGISNFEPISDKQLEILKRFRNVFDLAYRRYQDIALAEAQARESQIQLALERVRARSIAMHKSEELLDVITIVSQQLLTLGFKFNNVSFGINSDSYDFDFWVAAPNMNHPFRIHLPYLDSPVFNRLKNAQLSGKSFFVDSFSPTETKEWMHHLLTHNDIPEFNLKMRNFLLSRTGFVSSAALLKNIFLFLINYDGIPYSDEENNIIKRFAETFDQAYIRFLDLQKAEKQAREAEIELALERVRAKTMAMQKSDELQDVVHTLLERLKDLNVEFYTAIIILFTEDSKDIIWWLENREKQQYSRILIPYTDIIYLRDLFDAREKVRNHFSKTYSFEEKNELFDHLFNATDFKSVPEKQKRFLLESKAATMSVAIAKNTGIHLTRYTDTAFSEDDNEILRRFAKVFEQSYVRFLDLQRVEAQARESQIQLALERVRARTMAMHRSEELSETTSVLFQQFVELGVVPNRFFIGTMNEEETMFDVWITEWGGEMSSLNFNVHINEPLQWEKVFKAWKARDKSLVVDIFGEDLIKWNEYLESIGFPVKNRKSVKRLINTFAIFSNGFIAITTSESTSIETVQLLERFADVFNLTYRRFLDLQKAEAQAKEAEIELALERVRARSMAMQKSEELNEVIKLVYEQFVHLKINVDHAGFVVDYTPKSDWHFWIADERDIPSKITHPYFDSVWAHQFNEAKEKGIDFFATNLNFEEKNKFYNELLSYVPGLPQASKDFYLSCPGLAATTVLFDNVSLYIENFSGIPYSEEENKILLRFGKVFQQTYTRFLDLQKAEAQAREAEIELALERVRARTMAMHSSQEVGGAVVTLYDEVINLKTEATTCGIAIIHNTGQLETWTVTSRTSIKVPGEKRQLHMGFLDISMHPFLMAIVEASKNNQPDFSYDLEGESMIAFFRGINDATNYSGNFDLANLPSKIFNKFFFFREGALFVESLEELSQVSSQIFTRFAVVFGQTYTRYLDLKKAESQAREAQIETALERLRSRSMAMHQSEELSDVVLNLFQGLESLGFDAAVCNLSLVDKQARVSNTWTAHRTDKGISTYFVSIPFLNSSFFSAIIKAYDDQIPFSIHTLADENLKKHTQELFEKTDYSHVPDDVKEANKKLRESKELIVVSVATMKYGLLTSSRSAALNNEEAVILQRFAKVFEQTYTRFLDLQKAEAQAKEAQIEAALERVRSRSLAMHHSSELSAVVDTLLREFTNLEFTLTFCIINLIDEEDRSNTVWAANPETGKLPESYYMKFEDYPFHHAMWDAWKSQKKNFIYTIEGEEKKIYDEYLYTNTEFRRFPKHVQEANKALKRYVAGFTFFKYSGLQTVSENHISEDELNILERFGRVFEQSYTRFLDLQKAEAQAKEAQIEASLEKVRAVAMSMNKSVDLLSICEVSFKEFKKLGFDIIRNALIHIQYDEQKYFMDYDFSDLTGGAITKIEYGSHPVVEEYLKQIRSAKDAFYQGVIKEDQLEEWKEFRRSSGQIDDPRLEKASALYYYFFSIGVGDIGISTLQPIDESQIKILKRFRNVFDLAYRRYNDITLAEEQARETQIQLALERVRARTMAMHKSEELSETSFVLFEQLKELGEVAEQISIGIFNEKDNVLELYATIFGSQWKESGRFPLTKHPVHKKTYEAWKNQEKSLIIDLTGDELADFNKFKMENSTQYKTEEELPKNRWIIHSAFFSKGVLIFSTYEPRPVETLNILERFAGVFDLTYTRFLDLKKAEAQAREAEIEAALERVRSRTMAMQKSDELAETASHFFEQLNNLGIKPYRFNIAIVNQASEECQLWSTSNEGKVIPLGPLIPLKDHKVFNQMYSGWKQQGDVSVIKVQGEDRKEWTKYIMKYVSFNEYKPENIDLEKLRNEPAIFSNFFFKQGFIVVHTIVEIDVADIKIIQRFVNVFEQTYTRFLDLQKAEEQAREAQIEAALERVRAKAMAMHSSDDLSETMSVLFTELPKLGISSLRCGVVLLSKNNTKGVFYAAATTSESDSFTMIGSGDMITEHPVFRNQYECWLKNENYFTTLRDEELHSYYKALLARLSIPYKPREHKLQTEYGYYFAFSEGMFYAWSEEPYSDSQINILNRFKAIIDLTFRRYLDLKKAEAQAREAQIEAALEKVRGYALAMHNSDDISSTASMVFNELKRLGIDPIRSGVGLISKDENKAQIYSATSSGDEHLSLLGTVTFSGHPVFKEQYEHWLKRKDYFAVLKGKELTSYYRQLSEGLNKELKTNFENDEEEFGHWLMFSEGFLYAWSHKKYSETELNILDRFKKVIELTFRRYIDLKKAEAQARESVKQASLDRIRGEIASMRTSEDLNRITPVIWRELKNLEVPFFRCGVYIVDETSEKVQVYLTTPDGKSLGVLNLSFDSNKITSETVEHWKKKQIYKQHWNKEEFINWTKYLVEQNQIPTAQSYQGSSEPPESLDLHFVPFTQGMLYVGDVQPLTDEKLQLVKTLAEVFSIAYARYEDFKNLEEAKNKIEITLSELKSAQAQLIHSEKMASLGELTAGIAHEIKNPLNFVNNFSEVSRELLDEMQIELKNNNIEEVIDLVEDLKQNLDKINLHGKRADSIVKGMLLHSRGTSGEKTLTDINDLLDQYVNLAYHGMRATNKEFNITIEKDYDKTIEKINVVPQDISRVFLNIINNACYAAFDKKLKGENNFSPTLKVSTKNLKEKVEIIIGDNGNGIPKDHLDKIFQPFFTTKPSGEGTGLGLSLSYDIVTKVHGGELKVETKEGIGTEFIIKLKA